MKYYVDPSGNYQAPYGGYNDENNPKLPNDAVEVSGPPPHGRCIWDVPTQQWTGSVITWDMINEIRHPLIHEAVDVLDKYRNQQLQTGGATDIDSTKAIEWADYMQVLRDIPDLTINTSWTDGDDVVWPDKPT